MAHDVVIKGGTVVDGSGAPARAADVAIDGDRISDIGTVDASGAGLVVDADGAIVTPGFVDLHSHLDAQIAWDPLMSSSCYHGVTSVVMGNCGMTFAPVHEGQASLLAGMMESVEDIPARSILEGMSWDWETYGQYLDVVDALPMGINAGGMVGDVAVRTYVCGDAACEVDFRASDEELAAMAALVDEAIGAGAIGYSMSRSLTHHVPDGRWVPGTFADPAEYFVVAEPLARHGRGILECAPRYNETDGSTSRVDAEMAWIAELSRSTGRPFTFNLAQMRSMGDHYRRVIELADAANKSGAQLRPQTTPRSIGVLFSIAANTPLDGLASFAPLLDMDRHERLQALHDPALRQRLQDEAEGAASDQFERMYLLTPEGGAVYEYREDDTMAAQAAERGVSPVEYYIDALIDSDGKAVVNWPVMNEDFAAIGELLSTRTTVIGLADAGAHATQIMDASQATFFLSHWVRDKKAISIEEGVRRITSDTADLVGFAHRGTLRVGAYADINVIDLDALFLPLPEIVHDFPAGAPRFVQKAMGIEHTFVNGELFMSGGEPTGALSGRLLRSSD
ncbi:MAG: amidohydrolase family protein [Acidobacteria bacterium]|nr:amidohydrolase family protein [Acidobacteriota bacterium]